LLNVMASIPTVGGCFGAFSGLIGLVAAVWGIAIYIKASATANEFSLGKASLAAFLPVLVAMALAGLVLLGAILVAVLGSR
jgi:hypothetical protein